MSAEGQRVGRPRRASPVMLEEAAAELFLEQGYEGTTIEQISARAGVARTTFFNYFATKGDLLWVDLDAAIPRLRAALEQTEWDDAEPDHAATASSDALARVAAALREAAEAVPAGRVPWAVMHRELMGTRAELAASGVVRLLDVTDVVARFLERAGITTGRARSRSIAAAVGAAALAGAGEWIEAGTGRGPLADYVDDAVLPVLDGWRRVVEGESIAAPGPR